MSPYVPSCPKHGQKDNVNITQQSATSLYHYSLPLYHLYPYGGNNNVYQLMLRVVNIQTQTHWVTV